MTGMGLCCGGCLMWLRVSTKARKLVREVLVLLADVCFMLLSVLSLSDVYFAIYFIFSFSLDNV